MEGGDEDQYGIADLRQYVSGSRPFFPPVPPPPDLLSTHRGLAPPNHYYPYYDMPVFVTSTTSATTVNNISSAVDFPAAHGGGGGDGVGLMSGFEMEAGGINRSGGSGGADGVSGRWPRQETLILLEIRSRLDSKFKEANQKGPLWDEVSRIMSEEHGYQRSGKKCREKFENLYKYYKKTKEGKAGRQDGKHYRFFRQLEALYGGETSNSANYSAPESHFLGGNFQHNFHNNSISLANNQENSMASLSNFSDSEANSSDYNDDGDVELQKSKRSGKRRWKSKIIDFIDGQMKRLMEKQEAWMEKMMNTIEHKESERMMREEQWRKQDAARIDREHKLWASERAWIEARDAALMEAFHKLTGNDQLMIMADQIKSLGDNSPNADVWPDCESTRLVQLRTGMEAKFQEVSGVSGQVLLWEEIAARMRSFGHGRSGEMCKDKWDSIVNDYLLKCNKKRRDDLSGFYQNLDQPI